MRELQAFIGKENADRGWHDRWHEIADNNTEVDHIAAKLALVHSEVSEALEELRAGNAYDIVYYPEGDKPEGFGIELADALIRILDLGAMLGIDLEALVHTKLAFNRTRGHKHGGKVL